MSNIPAFFCARDAAHSQSCPLLVDQCERGKNNAEQHITLLQDSHGHASIQDIGINSPSENTYCSSGVKFGNQTSANTIQNASNSGMMGTAIINGSHNNINLCVDKPHIATLQCPCSNLPLSGPRSPRKPAPPPRQAEHSERGSSTSRSTKKEDGDAARRAKYIRWLSKTSGAAPLTGSHS